MLLKQLETGHLIEVEDTQDLTNPFSTTVSGRLLWGEETQDPEAFPKRALGFPSGEHLPASWLDAHYPTQSNSHQDILSPMAAGGMEAEQAGYHGA